MTAEERAAVLVRGQDARRDFHEFRAPLHRYAADEFRPPESYFDIST
jgi:hypothetical protein